MLRTGRGLGGIAGSVFMGAGHSDYVNYSLRRSALRRRVSVGGGGCSSYIMMYTSIYKHRSNRTTRYRHVNSKR